MQAHAVCVWLALLRAAHAVLNMDNYYFDDLSYCTYNLAHTQNLQYFGPRWGAPAPVQAAGGELWVSYPTPSTLTYGYEGSRYNASRCSFCPYSNSPPEARAPEYLAPGGLRDRHMPLHGPCLNGAPSTRMPCVQNLLLHPPEFVGEYFYPEQRVADPRLFAFPFAAHEWLEGAFPSSITNTPGRAPTNYGLGRGNALANLQTLRVMNNATAQQNETLSRLIQAPYLPTTIDGRQTERWAKWGQHFCRQGCHRDSQRQIVTVRPSDFEGQSPTLAYLNRRNGGLLPSLVRCAQCPPWQAGYNWGIIGNPHMAANPAQHLVAFDCYPWFGSVPTMLARTVNGVASFVFNVTRLVNHSAAADGVSFPPVNGYVEGRPCPPNTYNDACAHKHRHDAVASGVLPVCKPCPAGGWHTGGLSGAWFCLPPPGKTMHIPNPQKPTESPLRLLMALHRDPLTNASLLWARRDILGVEFECGSTPAHCYQCAAAGLSPSAVPDDFNREVILKHLLMWSDCPAGFYCPTAMDPPIPCPAAKPWSPAGSAALADCVCARGTYLRPSDNTCAPCAERDACPSGFFMSGWTRCALQDGATSPGACAPCGNLPPNHAVFANGAGKEAMLPSGVFVGVCPFTCAEGARLSGPNTCANEYACTPIGGPLSGPNGALSYSPPLAALRDGFLIWPRCSAQLNLTNAAARSAGWLPVSTSCAAANPADCANAACVITRAASFAADYACAACPQPPPAGGYYMRPALREDPLLASATCRPRCNTEGFYYNRTAHACQSCALFDATFCRPGFHLSGGGCYGSLRPFPASSSMDPVLIAAQMCVKCDLPMPPAGSGKWLDLASAPCEHKPCTIPYELGKTVYATALCGNTSDIVTQDCVASCPPRTHYMRGTCQPTATPVCVPCTAFRQGSFRVANCTAIADAEWEECAVPGTFCPGDGSVRLCPHNQTSSRGASSEASCYCPAGTFTTLSGACEPFRCPASSTVQFIAPGASYASASYMALDETLMRTHCLPCPPNSLAIANNGIGPQACLCLAAVDSFFWRDPDNGCTLCPPSPPQPCLVSEGHPPFSGRPDTCWRGLAPISADCVRIPPPFWLPILQQCAGGFEPSGAQRATPLEDVSGSALYLPRTTLGWSWLLRKDDAPTPHNMGHDYTIRRLVTTSDWNTWGDAANRQFVLWTVAEPEILAVFAAPIPPWAATNPLYNPYQMGASAWTVTFSASDSFFIEEIAAAQWQTPQTPQRLSGSGGQRTSAPTHVGAVLRVFPRGNAAATTLRLYVNTLRVNVNTNAAGSPQWGDSGSTIFSLGTPPNASTVALGHVYVSSASTFFLAYNTPAGRAGVAAVSVASQSIEYIELAAQRLDAAAFMGTPAYDDVQIYMVRDGVVRVRRWSSPAEMVELFFTEGARVRSLQIARPDPARAPVFAALVETAVLSADSGQRIWHPSGPPLAIVAADHIQRTFTPIQNMHPVARPALLAPPIPTVRFVFCLSPLFRPMTMTIHAMPRRNRATPS